MKKIVVLVIVVVMLLALSSPALAFGQGGAWRNHPAGVTSGFQWGGAVRGQATTNPLSFAGHIAGGFAGF